ASRHRRGCSARRRRRPNKGIFRRKPRQSGTLVAPFDDRDVVKTGVTMSTIVAAPAAEPKPLYTSLFVQVLAALILGIILGVAVPDFAISLKILSDAFLKLISMIVAPIVFCVVVHGIAGAGDIKKVGRVGV